MSFLKLFSKDIETHEDDEEDGEAVLSSLIKKKKDTMDGVLQTTVLETVLNDFHKLKIAQIQYMDDDMFIGLLLRAEDIGGINRKSPKDVSEMIQLISGGDIKAYISDELLKREEILLVPDAETWENIGEYKFMREAKYTIQILDEEGTIYDTEQLVTFSDVEYAIKNQKKLEDLIKEMPSESDQKEHEDIEESQNDVPEEAEEEDNTEVETSAPMEGDMTDDTEEDLNEIPDDIEEEEIEDSEEEPHFDSEEDNMVFLDDEPEQIQVPEGMQFASVSDVMDEISEEDSFSDDIEDENDDFSYDMPDGWDENENIDYDIEYEDNIEEEEEVEVSEEEVENTVFRKFYSDELGLEISMSPFYSEFVNKSDIIPFKTDRPAGWMNEQLNEKSIQYNQEIEQMHQMNVSKLRILYTKLMQETVDKIRLEVDINTTSNFYGQKYNELLVKKGNYDIDGEIEAYKEKLVKDWEEKLIQVGQDAANVAIQKYKEKYERQHEDDLYTADTYLRDKLDNEFQDMLRDLNNKRKMKAQEMLERYTDSVLKAVADEYLGMQDKEIIRIKEIQQEIDKFVDDHRKEDIAMAEVRKNEQRYKERLEEQMAIHRNEIENYKRQLEEREKHYRAELEQFETTHKRVMTEKETEYNTEVSKLKNKNIELKETYDELNEKYQKIDEIKRAEYENQIDKIRNANIALEEEMRAKDIETKRKSSGIIILIIVIIVAASAIGFMAGTILSSPETTEEINIDANK